MLDKQHGVVPLRGMRRRIGAASALALVLAGCACDEPPAPHVPRLPPVLAPPQPVDSDRGAVGYGGGCHAAPLTGDPILRQVNQLMDINPHWAPVVKGTTPEADPVLVHGIAHGSHGDTGGDFPGDHGSSDACVAIELIDSERGYLGTGNGGAHATLELEWESGKWPEWAWPGEGDGIVAMGRWMWDCGHSQATPGACSATAGRPCVVDSDCRAPACPSCTADEMCKGAHFQYSSELHPPVATAAIRRGRGTVLPGSAAAKPATRADVFVGADGGGAGDRCLMTHQDNYSDLLFSSDCYPLSQPLARVNAYDFQFDLPLPPRPPGAGVPVWRLEPREPAPAVPAGFSVVVHSDDTEPHLTVTVETTVPAPSGAMPTGFAGTFFAGWSGDATPLVHVRVTMDGVDISNPLKPATPVVREAPGWVLQASLNGEFRRLAGLDDVRIAGPVAQSITFDQYLPSDAKMRLFVNGSSRRCIDTMFGKALRASMDELALGGFVACLQTTNDPSYPGQVAAEFDGPDFGAPGGSAAFVANATTSDGGSCAASRLPCVTDRDCAGGERCETGGSAFAVRYRVERIP